MQSNMQSNHEIADDLSTARMLFVHAHPDDESIFTGGTIAKYAHQGAKIMILTCTLGEEGEVMFPEISGLTVQHGADQLGGYRYSEMQNSLIAFNKSAQYPVQHNWLGGLGTWRDSGMDWMQMDHLSHQRYRGNSVAEFLHKSAFMQGAYDTVQFQRQISQLSAVIENFHPTHLISYDEQGVYGHPDHIHVHKLCRIVWDSLTNDIPHLWEVTLESPIITAALHKVKLHNLPSNWIMPHYPEDLALSNNSECLRISVEDFAQIQRAALQAHRSQLAVHECENVLVLTNRIIQPFGYMESYHKIRSSDQRRCT